MGILILYPCLTQSNKKAQIFQFELSINLLKHIIYFRYLQSSRNLLQIMTLEPHEGS